MSIIDDVFLIIPSIAAVFLICAMVLQRLRFAVAALIILLCAIPARDKVILEPTSSETPEKGLILFH